MSRIPLEKSYPALAFRPRSRNWWAKLTGTPAECVHLDLEQSFIATLVPDILYVRGRSKPRRNPVRPEVCLCRDCFLQTLEPELAAYRGRVIAFEPDAETFTQYFFVAPADFDASGLEPNLSTTVTRLLSRRKESCAECGHSATWLWFSRAQVASLDDVDNMRAESAEHLCARHGAARLCKMLKNIPEASIYYMNVPYGESGTYVWI
jgi:hypothetical protein